MSFDLDNYVDVAQRITDFYERHPDGRLTTVDWDVKNDLDGKTFVWVHAKAYRTPEDPLPGDGIAWEPVPGPTQFTRDSELMNAQTAAWGRAIVALGFETKKIASKQEVQARQNGDGQATDPHGLQQSSGGNGGGLATDKQKNFIRQLAKKAGFDAGDLTGLTKSEASSKIEELQASERIIDSVAVGGGSDIDEIPFGPSLA